MLLNKYALFAQSATFDIRPGSAGTNEVLCWLCRLAHFCRFFLGDMYFKPYFQIIKLLYRCIALNLDLISSCSKATPIIFEMVRCSVQLCSYIAWRFAYIIQRHIFSRHQVGNRVHFNLTERSTQSMCLAQCVEDLIHIVLLP